VTGPPRTPIFRDRTDAGRELARQIRGYAGRPDALVLGLPRGGVPVAFEVAQSLDLPLDIFVVRKLGVPGREELAMGAIASGGVGVLNEDVLAGLELSETEVEAVVRREQSELERQERELRGRGEPLDVEGCTIVLVDDGLATGATMRAAISALRRRGAGRIIVAVPISSPQICAEFEEQVGEIVCARTPEPFIAVGAWYEEFAQTTDEEVRELLARARGHIDT
jgi:putative phosphoribosyl transferase